MFYTFFVYFDQLWSMGKKSLFSHLLLVFPPDLTPSQYFLILLLAASCLFSELNVALLLHFCNVFQLIVDYIFLTVSSIFQVSLLSIILILVLVYRFHPHPSLSDYCSKNSFFTFNIQKILCQSFYIQRKGILLHLTLQV